MSVSQDFSGVRRFLYKENQNLSSAAIGIGGRGRGWPSRSHTDINGSEAGGCCRGSAVTRPKTQDQDPRPRPRQGPRPRRGPAGAGVRGERAPGTAGPPRPRLKTKTKRGTQQGRVPGEKGPLAPLPPLATPLPPQGGSGEGEGP